MTLVLTYLQRSTVLAQSIQDLGSRFQGTDSGSGIRGVLVFLGVAAAVVVVTWLAARYANPPGPYRSPRRLFRELCGAHEMTVKERRLLKRLAKRRQAPPHDVFVQPDFFDLSDDESEVPEPLRNDVKALRERLFGAA